MMYDQERDRQELEADAAEEARQAQLEEWLGTLSQAQYVEWLRSQGMFKEADIVEQEEWSP